MASERVVAIGVNELKGLAQEFEDGGYCYACGEHEHAKTCWLKLAIDRADELWEGKN